MATIPPSTLTIESLVAKDISFHNMGEPVTILSGKFNVSMQPPPTISTNVRSREKLNKLLECLPMFKDMEPPMSNMNDLFSAAQRIPINLDGAPSRVLLLEFHIGIQMRL